MSEQLETVFQEGIRWRHRKGGECKVIAAGRIEETLVECIIYVCVSTGHVWVRPKDEFNDGRFVCIDDEARDHTKGAE